MQYKVRMLPTPKLRVYYRNARVHNRKQVTALAKVLGQYGFDQPIVVDGELVIIKGHGRYLAAVELGLRTVPVVVRTDLTPEQVKAARISDNKIFEMGELDQGLVRSEIQDFVFDGGLGAEELFDFLTPPRQSSTKASSPDTSPTVGDTTVLDNGTMLVCPKCQATFWETE